MKSFVILITIGLITKTAYNQSWAPLGATWHYEVGFPFSPSRSYIQYQVVGDTVINSKLCSIITQTDGALVFDHLIGKLDTAYTHEEENKVYVFDPSNNDFSLVYDFNAVAGDTWITTWDTCSYERLTSSVDSIEINGTNVKTLSRGGFTIIEKIGGAITLFHGFDLVNCNPPDTIAWEYPVISKLRCYEDDFFGLYNSGVAPFCDYILDITASAALNDLLKVHPNPAKECAAFTYSLPDNSAKGVIKIVDVTGRMVELVEVSGAEGQYIWDTSRIEQGIYLYSFIVNGINHCGKIVIQK